MLLDQVLVFLYLFLSRTRKCVAYLKESDAPVNIFHLSLILQHMLTVGQGLPNAEDVQTRGVLYQQLMEMTDLILDGYITQLQSLRESQGQGSSRYMEMEQRYHQERASLIMPLGN